MKKYQYTAPLVSIYALTSHDALLLTASQEGTTVLTDGGKASESGITTADTKADSYNIWDDDWSK